jgi:hypothetical protein
VPEIVVQECTPHFITFAWPGIKEITVYVVEMKHAGSEWQEVYLIYEERRERGRGRGRKKRERRKGRREGERREEKRREEKRREKRFYYFKRYKGVQDRVTVTQLTPATSYQFRVTAGEHFRVLDAATNGMSPETTVRLHPQLPSLLSSLLSPPRSLRLPSDLLTVDTR